MSSARTPFSLGLLLLAACGSDPAHPSTPEASAPVGASAAPSGDASALHAALVAAHKKAVETCLGGFGKGVPYAADLSIDAGAVKEASFEPLNSKFTEIPRDCLDKVFKAMPMAGASKKLHVKFAVKNDACAEPTCAKDDLKCTFERDIACSVVVE